jgi:hypothetical protein
MYNLARGLVPLPQYHTSDTAEEGYLYPPGTSNTWLALSGTPMCVSEKVAKLLKRGAEMMDSPRQLCTYHVTDKVQHKTDLSLQYPCVTRLSQ